jgi:hypothetical protein
VSEVSASVASVITNPTLLVSWSHAEPGWSATDRRQRQDAVLRLTDNLRTLGIDAELDLHQPAGTDWTRWGPDKVDSCDYVLIVGSPAWSRAWRGDGDPTVGAGAAAEADALKTLYNRDRDAFRRKVRLVTLPGTPTDVPLGLDGIERYHLVDDIPAALTDLIRGLSNQPSFPKQPLGTLPTLAPDDSWRDSAAADPAPAPLTPAHGETRAELQYKALTDPITVRWRDQWAQSGGTSSRTILTVHAVPSPPAPVSARRLATLSTSLVKQLRATGLFEDAAPLVAIDDPDGVTVTAPQDQSYSAQVRPGQPQGARVDRSGQVSAWHSLPADNMGSALDEPIATAVIEACLALAAATGVLQDDADLALAVEVNPITLLSFIDVSTLGNRSSATLQPLGTNAVKVDPDELVEARALHDGANEAAQTLTALLLRSWGQR